MTERCASSRGLRTPNLALLASIALASVALVLGCESKPHVIEANEPAVVSTSDAPPGAGNAAPAPETKVASEPAAVAAVQPEVNAEPKPVARPIPGKRFVRLSTNKGDLVLELDEVKAPISTENFLAYVRDGFYDGTVMHRIVPGFVVQGGGFDQSMSQKQTRAPIRNEWRNGLKNAKGTISMARLPSPDTATSQFFLNLKDNPALDGANGPGYAVFGRIVSGIEVLDAMGAEPTASAAVTDQQGRRQTFSDVPVRPIVLERAVEVDGPPDAPVAPSVQTATPVAAPQ